MTKSEFLNIYGKVNVSFSSYYKFTFIFRGKTESGEIIVISVGGDSDTIYRFDVDIYPHTIESLDPYCGYISGKPVESGFYEDPEQNKGIKI